MHAPRVTPPPPPEELHIRLITPTAGMYAGKRMLTWWVDGIDGRGPVELRPDARLPDALLALAAIIAMGE